MTDDVTDPLRPSDHADSAAPDVTQPALGVVGWLRWGWRQLTSMRTALVLLLLLAIAAVPGSLVPQRSADPNGVRQYFVDNPDLAPVLDNLSLFDVYTSPWFSAIYILLFVSLVGCVVPRTKHHYKAMRAQPPRTPARLARLDAHRSEILEYPDDTDAAAAATTAIEAAEQQLKKAGYRVARYDGAKSLSVSAERGYLRETGNLVFHAALVGVLLAVGIGGGFTYTGQTVIIEGRTWVNTMLDYTSFNPGRFVDEDALQPYALTLDEFSLSYVTPGAQGAGQAGDFVAHLTTQFPDADAEAGEVRVNHPLQIAGDKVYLMGNGYAPTITIRDSDGDVVFSESVPFLPQDNNMTSQGVVKVPDGLRDQVGLVGFFYPTAQELTNGAYTSVYGDLEYPMLTFWVYAGDLGIDGGVPKSVYTLDPSEMTQLAGGDSGTDSLELKPGDTVDLPDGLGTITFENETPDAAGFQDSVKRYVSLSIHRDAAATWVLVFAVLATAGLLAALFVPRRRMWVKATRQGHTVHLEYAGLARGEDPALEGAVEQFAQRHLTSLADPASAGERPTKPESTPDVD
ncbi:cytochrome c biogenesis protein [Microbacterium trichothecenolyticum]|uniref:cytochrome c biogenesis protein ResB n=1 Tax=Microbacterium trichothecenolyticum TaxID=69370 RepID=UPI0028599074|nr:cytochrome c biogenesis protein ResB [Microbacterium trichothecenolyticum]MDR7113580.1 cytochrome c biogenesis protein [Microbacterium trichothecenolyticum]